MKKYIGLIIAGLMPLLVPAQVVITSNFDVVLNGGTQLKPTSLVLTKSAPSGITYTGTGGIISEGEFNQVDWNIGTNTGTYKVPFAYSTTDYIPLTFNVTVAGIGSGMVKFSTYHGSTYNNSLYKPSDVTTDGDFGAADYSNDMVDRFWDVDANTGYGTKPTATITFTYIRTGPSEVAAPNNITEGILMAQRFNTSLSEWDDITLATGTDIVAGNTGTVSSGSVSPADLYRSWTLANDSGMILGIPVNPEISSEFTVWPNPAGSNINLKFGQGQEGNASISIVNVIGQELFQKNQYISTGTIVPINVSSLASGMYFVRVSSSNFNSTSKFIKE